jgi:hypothetical protein
MSMDEGSVHFSILTGRILLKDVTYHSSNQTIKVVKGQLQWRYWIRRPTSEEEIGAILGGMSLGQLLRVLRILTSSATQINQQHLPCIVAFRYPSRDLNGFCTTERQPTTTSFLKWRPPFLAVPFLGLPSADRPRNTYEQVSA